MTTYNLVDTIPFSQLEQLVAQGSVTEVAVGQDTIKGNLKDKLASGKSAFVTARVDPALAEKQRVDAPDGVGSIRGVGCRADELGDHPHL